MRGSNFAPVGADLGGGDSPAEPRCYFGESLAESATFISVSKVVCSAPKFAEFADVPIRFSNDGGEHKSAVHAPSTTYGVYDAKIPPWVDTVRAVVVAAAVETTRSPSYGRFDSRRHSSAV